MTPRFVCFQVESPKSSKTVEVPNSRQYVWAVPHNAENYRKTLRLWLVLGACGWFGEYSSFSSLRPKIGRIKALDKIDKIELPKKRQVVKFEFRVPPRSGDQVAMMEDLHKSYGHRVIYDGFNLTIRRGERWAVMGRNGAGKSTLLKMIAGATEPDAGTVRLGASLNMGYFAQQSLDILNPDLTVDEQLQRDFPHDTIGSLRSLAGAFQFSGEDVDKKIRSLSGGEKSRLAMARMLFNPPNFLVLDEPTNHLDLATKEMLVEALKAP